MRPPQSHRILPSNGKLSKEEAMMEPGSTTNNNSSPRWMVQLVGGAVLVLVGVNALLANLNLFNTVWRYWPLLLIGVGLERLVRPAHKNKTGAGIWLCLIGAWLLISNLELFGLGYSKSWPLLILGTGISIVWSALVPAQPANTPAEEKNGR